ncbi:thiamine pyrophosphokinase [Desertivirga arenae]|uniref:thiamine pyrophosphokinase n=1 Tax=Desertivirga arenae TaxID=2810309 RepID=UPI001A95E67A|nr:thiamine pyrophosphokinase [Pedobacter sp. SYSU D00823]
MSSHHIVRDKQEPALLIMDLTDFDFEHLGQLLEWSPTVIASQSEYEHVDSLGIKVDAIVTSPLHTHLQESTLIIRTENNPLQDALKYLVGEQYPSVNIIDASFCEKDYILYIGRINLVVLTPHQRIFPVNSGFSKWKAEGEEITILHGVKNLKTSGLIKMTEQKYRTEKDGFYTLTFEQPFTFVGEAL